MGEKRDGESIESIYLKRGVHVSLREWGERCGRA